MSPPTMRGCALPRLHVDWTKCDGHGSCAELLPELLEQDPWGYPLPKEGPDGWSFGAHLRAHAELAVRACPVMALKVVP